MYLEGRKADVCLTSPRSLRVWKEVLSKATRPTKIPDSKELGARDGPRSS